MSLLVLCNPTAAGGRAAGRLPEVEAELRRLRAEFETVQTLSAAHVAELAADAGAAGRTVCAVGGDGLLRAVAATLRGTDGRLAVIPAGRGNDFARVLGVPNDPSAAARLAVEGVTRRIDMGEVNGVPFLGIASFGFDSDVNRFANESKFRGNFVYLYAALRALSTWKNATFEVTVDGVPRTLRGASVVVANSSTYGGGMKIAPQAELDDSSFDVVAIGTLSRARLLAKLPKVFWGRHVDDPAVTFLSGTEVIASADRDFRIYADGDPVSDLPARVTIRPRCLNVVAPA